MPLYKSGFFIAILISMKRGRRGIPYIPLIGTISFILFAILIILYLVILREKLFFFYPWSDMPMHFLGGLVVGSVTYFLMLLIASARDKKFSRTQYVGGILVSVFTVGILWEIYEFIFGLTFTISYWPDTLSDIVMDILGGSFVAYCAYLHNQMLEKTWHNRDI
jgi:hypothetical protein